MATVNRRKLFSGLPSLQFRFARVVVVFVFISCLVTGLTVFYTTVMILGNWFTVVYPQERLVSVFQSVYAAFFVNLLIILPIIFYGALVFSSRIAGPLPKIYQALKEIGHGDFDVHLLLRKGDELQELVDRINEMASRLKERESKK